jgi:hypothetical protein
MRTGLEVERRRMSILIKGMSIPENCTRCDHIGLNVAIGCPVMSGTNGRATDCPLVDLGKHGDLIDRDVFRSDHGMKDDCTDCEKECRGETRACEYDIIYSKKDFCCWLDYADVVIEAEDGT